MENNDWVFSGLGWKQRFWSKVDKSAGPGGCWIWTAGRNGNGYGQMVFRGISEKAHRVSMLIATGTMPAGFVLHSCDVPACVNPAHLRVGTPLENVQDMDARGRRRTNGPLGAKTRASNRRRALIAKLAQGGAP